MKDFVLEKKIHPCILCAIYKHAVSSPIPSAKIKQTLASSTNALQQDVTLAVPTRPRTQNRKNECASIGKDRLVNKITYNGTLGETGGVKVKSNRVSGL